MKLLIPKPFRKNKMTLFKKFTILDFVILILQLSLALVIVFTIPLNGIWKLILIIPFLIPIGITILWSTKHDCRNYVLLFRWFKFKSYIRKFEKQEITKTK